MVNMTIKALFLMELLFLWRREPSSAFLPLEIKAAFSSLQIPAQGDPDQSGPSPPSLGQMDWSVRILKGEKDWMPWYCQDRGLIGPSTVVMGSLSCARRNELMAVSIPWSKVCHTELE